MIAAARAIHAYGVRPDRTIRFVLFTGEEQRLLGSQAYVEQHQAELPDLVCALVMNWGAGPITRFPLAGHPEMEGPLKNLFRCPVQHCGRDKKLLGKAEDGCRHPA